ncbi:MAG: hypothetical protein ACLQAT_04230 [Candidatus Binataceae bacterium]
MAIFVKIDARSTKIEPEVDHPARRGAVNANPVTESVLRFFRVDTASHAKIAHRPDYFNFL